MSVAQQVEKYIPASEDDEARWEPDGDYNDLEFRQAYIGRVSRWCLLIQGKRSDSCATFLVSIDTHHGQK